MTSVVYFWTLLFANSLQSSTIKHSVPRETLIAEGQAFLARLPFCPSLLNVLKGILLPTCLSVCYLNTRPHHQCVQSVFKFREKHSSSSLFISLFLSLLLCSLPQNMANLLNYQLRSSLFLNSFLLPEPSTRPLGSFL